MKLITITTVLILFASELFGQFGVKTGLTFSRQDNETIENDLLKTGIHAGIIYAIPLNDKLLLQPGLLLNQNGTIFPIEYQGEEVNTKININYLDIPILVKLLYPKEKFDYFADFGLTFGIPISSSSKIDGTNINELPDVLDENVIPGDGFDTSITVGIGLLLKKKYEIGLTTDLGLLNVNNKENKFRNHGIMMSFAYFINPIN